ncbi:MAG TPA: lipopolysaccharide heptosyltransferase I [Solimonas sp.]|nr:lipopolysaccharide heptosyltransferase I [Solimonas sp.]
MRVLIVKTSSLGDLVHALPALTDAARARPELRFDWLAERPFAEIPRWHPAVGRVIASDLRRWRRQGLGALRSPEWAAFRTELRAHEYGLVLDAQGLLKSAWLASRARGPRAGLDWHSVREPLVALTYARRYAVPKGLHAVERVRRLFAQALDYAPPESAPDFGLRRAQFATPQLASPYLVFLHATTWPGKCWAESSWQELGRWAVHRGLGVVLPWGSEAERATAERIAARFGGLVLPRLDLSGVASVLAHAQATVGVDTGLAHVGAAVGTPGITLYGPTLPGLTGTVGAHQVHLRSSDATTVDRARTTTVPVAQVIDRLEAWRHNPPA